MIGDLLERSTQAESGRRLVYLLELLRFCPSLQLGRFLLDLILF